MESVKTLQERIEEKANESINADLKKHFDYFDRFNSKYYGALTLYDLFEDETARENLEHCTIQTLLRELRNKMKRDNIDAYVQRETDKVLAAVKDIEYILNDEKVLASGAFADWTGRGDAF